MVTDTNGLPLVVLPSSSTRTRGDADAARRMYSTMRSHRTSFVSAPMRNPANCSGVGSGAAQARRQASSGMMNSAGLFELSVCTRPLYRSSKAYFNPAGVGGGQDEYL